MSWWRRAEKPAGQTAGRVARKTAIEPEVTVYEARRGWSVLDLRELWKYRELMFFLGMRDVKVRYRQAVLGIAWVVIMPLAQMVVGTLVFNRGLGRTESHRRRGLLCFQSVGRDPVDLLLQLSLAAPRGALVGQAGLLTKVYFPRLVIPSASMVTGLVDFAIGLVHPGSDDGRPGSGRQLAPGVLPACSY